MPQYCIVLHPWRRQNLKKSKKKENSRVVSYSVDVNAISTRANEVESYSYCECKTLQRRIFTTEMHHRRWQVPVWELNDYFDLFLYSGRNSRGISSYNVGLTEIGYIQYIVPCFSQIVVSRYHTQMLRGYVCTATLLTKQVPCTVYCEKGYGCPPLSKK